MAREEPRTILVIATAGILFSGYLSYYTFTTGQSACELFFFRLPSCFYGLVMYALIFLLCLLMLRSKVRNKVLTVMTVLSIVGILFAGFLTWYVLNNPSCTSLKILGIPPCVYGLAMYIIIFILAYLELRSAQ